MALVLAQGDQTAVLATYVNISHPMKIRGLQECVFGILELALLCLIESCLSIYLDTDRRVLQSRELYQIWL